MWGDVPNRASALKEAISFTGDHKKYGRYMKRVVEEWPVSCENALTDYNLNQKAWIGHAACALALKIPEDITRLAWGHLSYEQRFLANKEAERYIKQWQRNYRKDKGLHRSMGEQMLLWGDSRRSARQDHEQQAGAIIQSYSDSYS
jgi:hypothetical protein